MTFSYASAETFVATHAVMTFMGEYRGFFSTTATFLNCCYSKRIVCLHATCNEGMKDKGLEYTRHDTVDTCDTPECTSVEVTRAHLRTPHLPSHDVVKLSELMLPREFGRVYSNALWSVDFARELIRDGVPWDDAMEAWKTWRSDKSTADSEAKGESSEAPEDTPAACDDGAEVASPGTPSRDSQDGNTRVTMSPSLDLGDASAGPQNEDALYSARRAQADPGIADDINPDNIMALAAGAGAHSAGRAKPAASPAAR